MIYQQFQDKQLSMLGFGAMRLPTLADGMIDENQLADMVSCAIAGGVNYFDTAWPYHNGMSEIALSKALRAYPRDAYYLATKFPGHQICDNHDPAPIFEEQLKKCGVDYFDFYLLHNVNETSIDTYLDPKWDILAYFREQKRLGRIKHLGFSAHGQTDCLKTFLDAAGDDMEFCQIQLNWLDWTLQDAKAKVELLNQHHMPIWVMEPLRGGKLCTLDEQSTADLHVLRPDESIPGWGFRFLQDIPGVTVILSGMSNLQQMRDNVASFARKASLNAQENAALMRIAESMKNSVPCTACRYCTEYCPMGLDIPMLMSTCNELRILPSTMGAMRIEALPADKQPSACIGCGACAQMCPQKIDIPGVMTELAGILRKIPKWADICREREEAARKLAGR